MTGLSGTSIVLADRPHGLKKTTNFRIEQVKLPCFDTASYSCVSTTGV